MGTLTVVTYNVRHATLDEDGEWERRRAAVVDRLRGARPDVVCLQESTGEQHADIAAALPGYEWVGVADDPGSGEHNPIGYRPRLTLLGTETVWLSESGDPGSVGWDGAYPRVVTEAHLRAEGRLVTVYNTHFDHLGPRARRESAARLRALIDGLPDGRPAIAVGDFNAEPGSVPYERLVSEAFDRQVVAARSVADETAGPATTLTDAGGLRPNREVDHVFLTPDLAVESYTVDDTTGDGRYPSDHLPVVVEVAR